MRLEFSKYQGAGNDFVMVDNRHGLFPQDDTETVRRLCDRRYGIGADGLILLEADPQYDFAMVYYNSDGRKSTMCGNGGRCIAAFARDLGLAAGKDEMAFRATDGVHRAVFDAVDVRLGMNDITSVLRLGNEKPGEGFSPLWSCFLDTGSPHYVALLQGGLNSLDVDAYGRMIRYDDRFNPQKGTNVNFAVVMDGELRLRTYERGVEGETLACGTGAVATAVAAHYMGAVNENRIFLAARGGDLRVDFLPQGDGRYTDVWLTGEAEKVFEGIMDLSQEK